MISASVSPVAVCTGRVATAMRSPFLSHPPYATRAHPYSADTPKSVRPTLGPPLNRDDAETPLPVMGIGYSPLLDDRNTVRFGRNHSAQRELSARDHGPDGDRADSRYVL